MTASPKFRPALGGLLALAVLAACASGRELREERAELGDFRLAHTAIVAENATRGPASRSAEPEEWEEVLTTELRRRFDRYQGNSLYHLGISVEGYVLAIPGIPVVAAPRSALIIRVSLFDDAAGGRVNERPHMITALESLSGETVVSSGLTQSAEQQMQNLAENAVYSIERWLASNPDWFPPRGEGAAPDVAFDPDSDWQIQSDFLDEDMPGDMQGGRIEDRAGYGVRPVPRGQG